MIEILAQIIAPKTEKQAGFAAGIVLWDDNVVESADVVKFMRRWSRDRVREYCAKRGWKIAVVHRLERERP